MKSYVEAFFAHTEEATKRNGWPDRLDALNAKYHGMPLSDAKLFEDDMMASLESHNTDNSLLIDAIGYLRIQRAGPAISPYLKDPDVEVRKYAILTLGDLQYRPAFAEIATHVEELTWFTMVSLCKIDFKRARPYVIDLIEGRGVYDPSRGDKRVRLDSLGMFLGLGVEALGISEFIKEMGNYRCIRNIAMLEEGLAAMPRMFVPSNADVVEFVYKCMMQFQPD